MTSVALEAGPSWRNPSIPYSGAMFEGFQGGSLLSPSRNSILLDSCTPDLCTFSNRDEGGKREGERMPNLP